MSQGKLNKIGLENVKSIDQRSKTFVNGYIRSIQKLFPKDNIYYTIPALVIHWILLYYYLGDEFDDKKYRQCYTLSKKKTIIKLTGSYGSGCAFMTRVARKPGIHCWKFKLLRLNTDTLWMTVGVWKTKRALKVNSRLDGHMFGLFYGWLLNYRQLTEGDTKNIRGRYAPRRCKTGDIVEMILDLDKFQLKYVVNGEDFGVAFDNIEDTGYRVAVSMNKTNDEIEFISYQVLK